VEQEMVQISASWVADGSAVRAAIEAEPMHGVDLECLFCGTKGVAEGAVNIKSRQS
jgi:hypothetical protein